MFFVILFPQRTCRCFLRVPIGFVSHERPELGLPAQPQPGTQSAIGMPPPLSAGRRLSRAEMRRRREVQPNPSSELGVPTSLCALSLGCRRRLWWAFVCARGSTARCESSVLPCTRCSLVNGDLMLILDIYHTIVTSHCQEKSDARRPTRPSPELFLPGCY